jgi:hypothetical protein
MTSSLRPPRWVLAYPLSTTLLRTALVLVLASLVTVGARAQESDGAEPAEYRPTIERALDEYQLGNFQEARDQFSRAHALFPNARTLRGLGFTAFELRNYVDAVQSLKGALASQVRPLTGKLRTKTEEMLERARGYVGTLSLKLEPPNAVLSIDGIRASERTPSLELDVGDHVLEFRAEGRLSERRAVRIKGGQTEVLEVSLARVPRERGPTQGERPVAQVPVYKRWWLWTTIGLVVAGAATGVALALTRDDTSEYRAAGTENTPPGVAIEALRSW